MSKKKIIGNCHICGNYTDLTFEHVPPEAAFNDRKLVKVVFDKLIQQDSLDNLECLKGPQLQRGMGAYTLCANCNSNTGAWYGNAFVDWAYQGLRVSTHAQQAPSLFYVYHLFLLRIIKQIACMFLSANLAGLSKNHGDLVRFVLNREDKYLTPRIRFYASLNISNRLRQPGISSMVSLAGNMIESSKPKVFSEIAFPPFIYVMCIDSPPPDDRLFDISFFAKFGFNDWTDLSLKMPVLPVYTWFPGDYRAREDLFQ